MKRFLPVALIVTLLLGVGSAAFAAWLATGTGTATAAAGTLGAGSTPTAAITSRTPTSPSAVVQVDWVATAEASGYSVERAAGGSSTPVTIGSDCDTAPVTGLSCNEAATPEGVWRYRITPRRGGWSGPVGAWSDDVIVVPAQPTALTATSVSQSRIDLAWADNSQLSGRTSTLQSRPSSSSTWNTLTSAPVGTTNYAHTGLTCGTTYHYQVRVGDGDLQSPFSSPASATTAPCPQPQLHAALTVTGSGNTRTATIVVTDESSQPQPEVTVTVRAIQYRASNGSEMSTETLTCTTWSASGSCPIEIARITGAGSGNTAGSYEVQVTRLQKGTVDRTLTAPTATGNW